MQHRILRAGDPARNNHQQQDGKPKTQLFHNSRFEEICIGSRCYALCPTTRKATTSCSFLAPLRPTNKHDFICQVGSPSHTRRPLRPRPPNTWGFIHSAKLSTPTLHFFTHITAIITRITEPHRRCSQPPKVLLYSSESISNSPHIAPSHHSPPPPGSRQKETPKGHHQTFLPEPPAACSAPYSPIFSNFN